jgi:cold shock CspA family protein
METRRSRDVATARMSGALLWFNEQKATGVIVADGGERVRVAGSGFADGHAPVGRCAGTRVSFDVVEEADGPAAVRVVCVTEEASRRARPRRSQRRG